jgi:hypothetical protein
MHKKFQSENLKGKNYLRDEGVDGSIGPTVKTHLEDLGC